MGGDWEAPGVMLGNLRAPGALLAMGDRRFRCKSALTYGHLAGNEAEYSQFADYSPDLPPPLP